MRSPAVGRAIIGMVVLMLLACGIGEANMTEPDVSLDVGSHDTIVIDGTDTNGPQVGEGDPFLLNVPQGTDSLDSLFTGPDASSGCGSALLDEGSPQDGLTDVLTDEGDLWSCPVESVDTSKGSGLDVALGAIPAPGALVLGLIGAGLGILMRRNHMGKGG